MQSGESEKEKVTGEGIGELEMEELVPNEVDRYITLTARGAQHNKVNKTFI